MKKEWKNYIAAGVTIFCVFLAIHYWPLAVQTAKLLVGAASPLLIGCVMAYLLNILMSTYERWYFPGSRKEAVVKSRRIVCMLASFLTLAGIVFYDRTAGDTGAGFLYFNLLAAELPSGYRPLR